MATRRKNCITFLQFLIWLCSIFTNASASKNSIRAATKRTTANHPIERDARVRQGPSGQTQQHQRALNPSLGDFKLLVLLVRFPEDANVALPTHQYFADLCSNEIRPYFSKQSYGKYNINECVVMD
jgi:hypothetical protein